MIQQLTANLAVETIEPSVAFFQKIGFEVSVQVPEGDRMGFAILVQGHNQVMFQTRSGLIADNAAFAAGADTAPVMLYITVADLDAVIATLEGYPVKMAERETFYGAREVSFSEPGGHLVTFAEFADPAPE